VHGVARRSAGAYLYPFAVAATFLLSRGDPLLFCAPVAVMALADTGAALVGRRLGRTAYRVMDGARTVEGSAVFFGLALGIVGLALVADGRVSLPGALGASLIAAGLTTAVEAISVRGVDNLFVPWAAWLVLDRAVHGAPMAGWLEGMWVAGVGIAVASRRLALRPAGAASLFVFATLAGGIGGAGWLVPMVALVPLLAWFERGDPADLEAVFPGIVASLLVVVAAAHSDPGPWRVPFLVTLGASGTIAMLRARRGWLGIGIAALLPASAAWAWDGGAPAPLVAGGIGGLLLWLVVRHGPLPGRRLVASLVPGLVARILVGALG
jgi:phytol kinase